jgi:SNF2 family DNA or RNA helicase
MHAWLRARNKKMKVEYVHGAMKDSKRLRAKVQERFQNGTTRVVLLQVALGKFGWNLSKSSTAIYYSNTYNFEDRSQSEDRIVHLKKKDDCLYLDLVTLGTPDEDLVEALSVKRMNARLFNMRMRQASLRIMLAKKAA